MSFQVIYLIMVLEIVARGFLLEREIRFLLLLLLKCLTLGFLMKKTYIHIGKIWKNSRTKKMQISSVPIMR